MASPEHPETDASALARRGTATALGIAALVLWSTTIAVARSLREALGVMGAPACIFVASGVVGTVFMALRRGELRKARRLPPRYLYGCGGIFVAYMLFLYLAVGLAGERSRVLEVGVINYLWPGLTLVLSVPILETRARVWLVPGALVAFGGVVLAAAQAGGLSWSGFGANMRENSLPYLLALGAGVTWPLYSNLSRRWAADAEGGAVPLFLLATGLAFAALSPFFEGGTGWTLRTALELAYMVIFPATLAYAFWDVAMRRGRIVLVTSLSYLVPVAATLVSCLYLGIRASGALWAACAMVIAGAVICRLSVSEPAPPGTSPPAIPVPE